jgi:hypothetical protein
MWFLARAKMKPQPDGSKTTYYGAYLGGFPERARVLIGAPLDQPVLHVCGGMSRYYPYARGFGVSDKTMDLDPACAPDYLHDCRDEGWPNCITVPRWNEAPDHTYPIFWAGILIDPPYSEEDAKHYNPGADKYPSPSKLVTMAINTLMVGRKVGIIHYMLPRCPKNAKFVACVGVVCGFNNRIRCFSVFERIS